MRRFWLYLIAVVAVAFVGFVLLRDGRAPGQNDIRDTLTVPGVLETAELHPAVESSIVGVAARFWDGSRFTFTVNTNLGDPDDGTFYETWLMPGDSSQAVSVGRLKPVQVGYGLTYISDEDLSDLPVVIVSLEDESRGHDLTRETPVLQGNF